ncbi:hypothetical protein HK105_203272 [Polyrhizophydium stewartii]|uniref:Cyanocobalamin reductase (cyanide-eliminating) n=1 Tax=Polyrhizophydium stewartii TaxID=2732419 RepID=A0ABR4NCG9_9FUNG|nr:hypothetical protein HK105_000069 [Polyrhizophydium stewartii]
MPEQWQAAVAAVRTALEPYGMTIVQPFCLGWYNAAVDIRFQLDRPRGDADGEATASDGRDSSRTLGILVGNTSAMWTPFLRFVRSQPAGWLAAHPDPLDAWTQTVAMADAATAVRTQLHLPHHSVAVRYPFETGTRMVGFQACAHAAGLAFLHRGCGLCVHADFGPWFAMRAVVLVDIAGPAGPPPVLRDPVPPSEGGRLAARVQDLIARPASTPYDWRPWLQLRDDLAAATGTTAHRYPDDMVEYHYSKNRAVIERAVAAME